MKSRSLSAALCTRCQEINAKNTALLRAPHSVQIERTSETHVLAKIEIRGRIYATRYAANEGQEPTSDEVLKDWRETPRDFSLYNESAGAFL